MVESLRRRAGRFGLDLIMVNVWEGTGAREEASRYRDAWDLLGTVLLDETAEFARALGIRGVPTNVFVDEHGIVQSIGATTSEELLEGAERLEPDLRADLDEIRSGDRIPGGFGDGEG